MQCDREVGDNHHTHLARMPWMSWARLHFDTLGKEISVHVLIVGLLWMILAFPTANVQQSQPSAWHRPAFLSSLGVLIGHLVSRVDYRKETCRAFCLARPTTTSLAMRSLAVRPTDESFAKACVCRGDRPVALHTYPTAIKFCSSVQGHLAPTLCTSELEID